MVKVEKQAEMEEMEEMQDSVEAEFQEKAEATLGVVWTALVVEE